MGYPREVLHWLLSLSAATSASLLAGYYALVLPDESLSRFALAWLCGSWAALAVHGVRQLFLFLRPPPRR